MKLLYYLPSIGEGNLDIKRDILLHNLNSIHNTIKESFDVSLNCYTPCEEIITKIKALEFITNIYIYEKKGVLTELFLTNPNNDKNQLYDYILFVLDDV